MGYKIPLSGAISFGTLAGNDRSILSLKNAVLSTTNTTTTSLCSISTWVQANSSYITASNMVSGYPYRMSEFRSASSLNVYLELIFRIQIDGMDDVNWIASNNTVNVVNSTYPAPSSTPPHVTYRKYNSHGNILSGSVAFNRLGVTNLPFEIPITTTVVKLSATGRGTLLLTYPNSSNSYTTSVRLNDNAYGGNSLYTCTLLYTL